ncbi:hypothetical protein HZS_5288 [Henneguya salminicola]|nr:hypothetical protein HZS_5288 [Henneguya salminicola]
MAEPRLYDLIFDQGKLHQFLVEKSLLLTPEFLQSRNVHCKNANCHDQSKGFYQTTRRRKLTVSKADELINEDADVLNLPTLRCKSCYTFFSPRTGTFLSYHDSLSR